MKKKSCGQIDVYDWCTPKSKKSNRCGRGPIRICKELVEKNLMEEVCGMSEKECIKESQGPLGIKFGERGEGQQEGLT